MTRESDTLKETLPKQQHCCVQPERMSIAAKRSQILDIAAASAWDLAHSNACLSDLAGEKAALSSRLCALGNELVHIRRAASEIDLSPEVAAVLAAAGHAQVQQDPAFQAASWRPAACDADLTKVVHKLSLRGCAWRTGCRGRSTRRRAYARASGSTAAAG